MTIYPIEPPGPKLIVDSGNVLREDSVARSKFAGRMFYVEKKNRHDWPDWISRSEADNYRRLGLDIALNYEDLAANWCTGGYAIGRDRGDWVADRLDEVGLADIPVVYCSVDFRPSNDWELNQAMECLRGFQESRLGRRGRGVYGFDTVVEEAHNRDLADYFWLCGDGVVLFDGDWRNGVRSSRFQYVNLWQQNNFFDYSVDGVQADLNYVLTDDFGQLRTGKEEPFVALNQEDQNKILAGASQLTPWEPTPDRPGLRQPLNAIYNVRDAARGGWAWLMLADIWNEVVWDGYPDPIDELDGMTPGKVQRRGLVGYVLEIYKQSVLNGRKLDQLLARNN
ncbi:glycoside hydrolase domain-containing protein [Nocardia wallacei]|uniref:glycoside hydrolase domain-containing protein n=1 Tax=Nocardia wallacei TaxID=480035 RepID=UPI002457EDFB|nr:glycoside hydrolase domain-containing protein [Nocardia wallacei]